jgi:hypothetical protein
MFFNLGYDSLIQGHGPIYFQSAASISLLANLPSLSKSDDVRSSFSPPSSTCFLEIPRGRLLLLLSRPPQSVGFPEREQIQCPAPRVMRELDKLPDRGWAGEGEGFVVLRLALLPSPLFEVIEGYSGVPGMLVNIPEDAGAVELQDHIVEKGIPQLWQHLFPQFFFVLPDDLGFKGEAWFTLRRRLDKLDPALEVRGIRRIEHMAADRTWRGKAAASGLRLC